MTRCPKCKSNLVIPENGGDEIVVTCSRCQTEVELQGVPVRGTGARRMSGSDSDADGLMSRGTSDQKSKVVRRRYYSRTRLPKNVTPTKPRRRKRKRKTKFTRADLVKVILGGMMAFPVAQIILWWGFAKDPLQLGPTVAAGVPFVVPRPFRGGEPLPIEEEPEFVANPESNLLLSKPIDFSRPAIKNNANPIQKGMPRQGVIPDQR